MTVVPKKKSDSRSTANNNNSKPAARAASSAASASGGEPVTATKSEPVDQVEGQQYQDQQQQHQSPYVQCSTSAGDSMNNQEEVNNHSAHKTAAASNGDENDRRQLLPHQQPQQHHQQHQHSKNMNSKADSESNVNHVILITVINPHYPITCDLINQICSAYGTVKRIVIFKKNGVQAMVEFDSVEEAKKAKNFLNGCDVYSGCCTLKIEFAKPVRLNVHRNDSGSWDYTNPNLASGPNNQQQANSTETGLNDNQQQQPNHHHHQQQHHHHLQQGPTVVGQHGAYLHGMNAPHQHLVRGGPGMGGRRTGGSVGGGTGGSLDAMASHQSSSGGHNQHFQSTQHMHHPGNHQQQQQQHSKQSIPPTLGGQHGGGMHQTTAGYVMGQPPQLDQSEVNSADTSDTFHQQDTSGFNVPRSSGGPVGGGGQHQQNQFVGIDTSMPTSATSTTTHINPHAVHSGNVYPPRQDGSHPHNQSHHQHQSHHQTHQLNNRGGGLPGSGLSRAGHGHNPSFPQINTANALMAGASHLAAQGTVMMVYGLSLDWMNCDRLFNLFCLYGNVVRVSSCILC